MRVQKIVVGAGISKPSTDVERGSETNLIPDILLSTPATTRTTIAEIVLSTDETTVEESGA